MPDSPDVLPATGERTAPGLPDEEYWFARHRVAYSWIAERMAPHAVVIDAGAGEGYGLASLPGRIRLALDYDGPTVAHLHRRYPQLHAVVTNLASLPVRAAIADAVISLQVLEHIWDPMGFLRELRRVGRPGGEVVLTTPNRVTFSPGLGRGERPTNPFHIEEYDAAQVSEMMTQAGLTEIEVRGVHHGHRISAWEHAHGSLVDAQVNAALRGSWPAQLRTMVASVTERDFTVSSEVEGCQDLLATARVPR